MRLLLVNRGGAGRRLPEPKTTPGLLEGARAEIEWRQGRLTRPDRRSNRRVVSLRRGTIEAEYKAMRALALAFFSVLALGCAQGGGPSGGLMPDMGEDADPNECSPACGEDERCVMGMCVGTDACGDGCASGESCCVTGCSTLPTDVMNCGACERPCGDAGDSCLSGQCRCGGGAGCLDGEACCGGACEDLQNSVEHCGACNRACGPSEVCQDGTCVAPPCDPECGEGESCDPDTTTCRCGAGPGCTATQACCAGGCLDTQSDPNNCGGCGIMCSGAEVCMGGTCTTDIPCVPSCAAGESCVGGVCRCGTNPSCGSALSCCSGVCVETDNNVRNCGRCGLDCGARSCCSGRCIDTQTDEDNCGRCGNGCDSRTTDACTTGRCTCGGGGECLLVCFFGDCQP